MALEILKPGLSTTVQDLGRPGYYHLGIPESGAMDRYALVAANLLVGNPEGAAALEAVFLAPEIRFERDAIVAVCGAEMPAKVDGVEQPGWTSFAVRSGQTLSFGYLKGGARGLYRDLGRDRGAGRAGFALDLRSRRARGLRGARPQSRRPVAAWRSADRRQGQRIVAQELRRGPGKAPELRVLPGLYWRRLTEEAGANFFADTWKVAPEADRIGYRFRGGRPMSFVPRKPPFAPARTRRTSSIAAIPTDPFRFLAEPSRSSFTATPCLAAAISCSEP